MHPRPLQPAEKVAPVVYALLIDEIDPDIIAQAIMNASTHTPSAIRYALHQIMPTRDVTRPVWTPPEPIPFNPSDEEKENVRKIIADAHRVLRGNSSSPG